MENADTRTLFGDDDRDVDAHVVRAAPIRFAPRPRRLTLLNRSCPRIIPSPCVIAQMENASTRTLFGDDDRDVDAHVVTASLSPQGGSDPRPRIGKS